VDVEIKDFSDDLFRTSVLEFSAITANEAGSFLAVTPTRSANYDGVGLPQSVAISSFAGLMLERDARQGAFQAISTSETSSLFDRTVLVPSGALFLNLGSLRSFSLGPIVGGHIVFGFNTYSGHARY
jgi:hypothetical protein